MKRYLGPRLFFFSLYPFPFLLPFFLFFFVFYIFFFFFSFIYLFFFFFFSPPSFSSFFPPYLFFPHFLNKNSGEPGPRAPMLSIGFIGLFTALDFAHSEYTLNSPLPLAITKMTESIFRWFFVELKWFWGECRSVPPGKELWERKNMNSAERVTCRFTSS